MSQTDTVTSVSVPLVTRTDRSGGQWPEADVARLRELASLGLSASQIEAQMTGYSRSAVIGKIYRMGLPWGSARPREAKRPPQASSARPTPKRPPAANLGASGAMRQAAADADVVPLYREVTAPEGQRKGVLEIGPHDCRWPIGDPQEAGFHFCAQRQVDGLSFCEFHARRAYQPPQVRTVRGPMEWRLPGRKVAAR